MNYDNEYICFLWISLWQKLFTFKIHYAYLKKGASYLACVCVCMCNPLEFLCVKPSNTSQWDWLEGRGGEGEGGKLEDKGGIPTWAIKWLRAEPGSMRIHAFKLVFKCQESNISPARFFFYSDSVRIVCSYIERLVESGARSVWFLNIFFLLI